MGGQHPGHHWFGKYRSMCSFVFVGERKRCLRRGVSNVMLTVSAENIGLHIIQ